MDVRDLGFEDGSFDVAIDKGTMDAMMTAKGDVWVGPTRHSAAFYSLVLFQGSTPANC